MKKKIYGWHFTSDTLRDGSPIPKDNVWLEYKGEVKMCQSGLHFSDNPWDALQYAPGPILCYVELEDVVDLHSDKGVCRRRKIIAKGDATEALRYFARMQALGVIDLYPNETDDVVFDYLATGDENFRAAARDAARDAAWAAAWAAARDAAWAAAWAAEGAAARDAARDAAWAAAWAAARDAARDAAGAAFNELIYECFEDVLK